MNIADDYVEEIETVEENDPEQPEDPETRTEPSDETDPKEVSSEYYSPYKNMISELKELVRTNKED